MQAKDIHVLKATEAGDTATLIGKPQSGKIILTKTDAKWVMVSETWATNRQQKRGRPSPIRGAGEPSHESNLKQPVPAGAQHHLLEAPPIGFRIRDDNGTYHAECPQDIVVAVFSSPEASSRNPTATRFPEHRGAAKDKLPYDLPCHPIKFRDESASDPAQAEVDKPIHKGCYPKVPRVRIAAYSHRTEHLWKEKGDKKGPGISEERNLRGGAESFNR